MLYQTIRISGMLTGLTHIPFHLLMRANKMAMWPSLLQKAACLLGQILLGNDSMVANSALLVLAFHRYLLLRRSSSHTNKLTPPRIILVLAIWLVKPLLNSVHVYAIREHESRCFRRISMLSFDFFNVIFIDFPVTTMTLFINVSSLLCLAEKRRRLFKGFNALEKSINRSSSYSSYSISNNRSTINRLSRTQLILLSSSSNTNHHNYRLNESHAQLNELIKRRSRSRDDEIKFRRLSTRFHRSFKKELSSILCVSSLIANMLLTQYFFYFSVTYVLFKRKNFYLVDYSTNIIYLFPLLNPILLFLFNRSMRIKIQRFTLLFNKNSYFY